MRVEGLNQFLNRKLEEDPERVQAALHDMLQRYKRDPRTMSALIDTSGRRPGTPRVCEEAQLGGTHQEQRGTSEVLAAGQRAALEGVARPGNVQAPAEAPEASKSAGQNAQRGRADTSRTADPNASRVSSGGGLQS